MKSLFSYIKRHTHKTRQDCLLFVVNTYGSHEKGLWRILGYRSLIDFDRALSKAKSDEIKQQHMPVLIQDVKIKGEFFSKCLSIKD